MRPAEHWNTVYAAKGEAEVSWYEPSPSVSLELLEAAGLTKDSCVLDVGGGDSRLVDELAARGLECLTVLDVSGAALARARARLGAYAAVPMWIEADVTGEWSARPVDIWHDRAVFHFLTDDEDRKRYREHMEQALKPGGAAIIATFSLDGPDRCSGLPVRRYSGELMAAELGTSFTLVESRSHSHTTPWGSRQQFQYCRFVRSR